MRKHGRNERDPDSCGSRRCMLPRREEEKGTEILMKRIPEKGEISFMNIMKEKYQNPEIEFYPDVLEKDILTASDNPLFGENETPMIFFG